MTLRLVGSDTVHLARGTFMWIALTRFAIEQGMDDLSLLGCLIATPGYAHDYASPFDERAIVTEPAVHGRWWRSSIRPASFERWTAAEAEALLQRWADVQDWTDPAFRQPPAVQGRLHDVYALLRSGTAYHLINPGPADEHEYGYVTGQSGFHEFVVIDRPGGLVHVVVASDD
ncbi:hypothetical protein [Cellulomonas soli]